MAALAHSPWKERIPDDKIEVLAGYGIPVVATVEVYERMATLGIEPRQATALERETAGADVLASFDEIPQRWQERVVGDKRFDLDPGKIDLDAYFDSYRVLAVYLGYLDKTLGARKL